MPDGQNSGSVNVPVGEWVDVPTGMVAAPDTYVDKHGVLRSCGDDSCVVWHVPGCPEKGIQAEDIIYDVANAPWCPKCYMSFEAKREAEREKQKQQNFKDKIRVLFDPNANVDIKSVTINKESSGNE